MPHADDMAVTTPFTTAPLYLQQDTLRESDAGALATVDRAEWLLWLWVSTYIFYEVTQLKEDFEWSFRKYIMASGNQLDATSAIVFSVAFVCRAIPTRKAYVTAVGLFMLNLLVWGLRINANFSIIKTQGVIHIAVVRIISRNVVPFIVFAAAVIICFEVAAYFFTWLLERDHKSGEFFNMFSQVATDDLDYARELGILWWDRPALSVQVVSIVFKTVFFLMTVVILMNLLIAMMTNTFKEVFIIADQEWRLVYAQKVKEFYESTVTPPPLNIIEDLLNTLMRSTVARNIR